MTTSTPAHPTIPTTAEELTPAWLSKALGRGIVSVRAEYVGTGQLGRCARLEFTDEHGVTATLVAKLPTEDPASRTLVAGAYVAEALFYTDLADTVAVRTPDCHYAEVDAGTGDFVLLLDDLAPSTQGDQIEGCTPERVRAAVINLAGLHGPRWSDESLLLFDHLNLATEEDADTFAELYGPTTDLFLANLGDLVSEEDAATLRACVPVARDWMLAQRERFAIVHGDYRLDNLMFHPDQVDGVHAVDWQTYSLALPARDLAYAISTSLEPEVRREHERDLVAAYHQALVGHGVRDLSLEECFDDYVFALLQAPLVATFGCAYGARTERGDLMFATMVRRACAAIRDHDAITHIHQVVANERAAARVPTQASGPTLAPAGTTAPATAAATPTRATT